MSKTHRDVISEPAPIFKPIKKRIMKIVIMKEGKEKSISRWAKEWPNNEKIIRGKPISEIQPGEELDGGVVLYNDYLGYLSGNFAHKFDPNVYEIFSEKYFDIKYCHSRNGNGWAIWRNPRDGKVYFRNGLSFIHYTVPEDMVEGIIKTHGPFNKTIKGKCKGQPAWAKEFDGLKWLDSY